MKYSCSINVETKSSCP